MSGVGIAAVGLLLCFAGLRSIHLAVLASGFAVGWLVAESLGATPGVAAIVALACAVAAWVLSMFVFRSALFVVGAIAGGVVGAKLFGLLSGDDGSIVLAVVFVVAVATLTGVATQRFRDAFLGWACAFGGAGLALSGLARMAPDALGFLREPTTTVQSVFAAAAWVVLAVLGWSVQRRWADRGTAAHR